MSIPFTSDKTCKRCGGWTGAYAGFPNSIMHLCNCPVRKPRVWQDLTDEEIVEAAKYISLNQYRIDEFKAVIDKFKEKNLRLNDE